MKLYTLFIAMIMTTGFAYAQENDIEIFEKKEGQKNIVVARNIGKVSYLVTLSIEAEGMIVSPGIRVEGVVPPGYMKELATLEPQPGKSWSYGYDVSYVEHTGQASDDKTNADSDHTQIGNSSVEVPVPPTDDKLSDAAIIVYTRQGCGRCAFVKKELKSKNIDFEEVDVNSGSADANNMWQLLRESGFKGTSVTMPVVKLNGELHYNIKDLNGFVSGIAQ